MSSGSVLLGTEQPSAGVASTQDVDSLKHPDFCVFADLSPEGQYHSLNWFPKPAVCHLLTCESVAEMNFGD